MLCQVEQLGMVGYAEGLRLQQARVATRKAGTIPDTLLLLEHPHVYTLGRNANRGNLLFSSERLSQLGAQVFETDRGGDVTYHGPGQLVGYPIFDLKEHRRDISWYMRTIEEVFIRIAKGYGISAGRLAAAPGV
jgi:lipoyl(octanoyl) transferase